MQYLGENKEDKDKIEIVSQMVLPSLLLLLLLASLLLLMSFAGVLEVVGTPAVA
jgi:hypothetical protein